MLHTQTSAYKSPPHVCLLFALITTLAVTVCADIRDAFDLRNTTYTTCPSRTGIWTVGANKNGSLTIVHSNGTTYTPPQRAAVSSDFKGGHCLESNASKVFFISDSATGTFTIVDGTPNDWQEDKFPKGNVQPKDFIREATAVGFGSTPGVITMVAAFERNIAQWNVSSLSSIGIVNLKDLIIPNNDVGGTFTRDRILGMVLAGDNLFLHYDTDKDRRLYIVKIHGDPNTIRNSVAVGSNMTLVPVTESSTTVAMVDMSSPANTISITYYDQDLKGTTQSYQTQGTLANDRFVVDQNSVRILTLSGVDVAKLPGSNGGGGGTQTESPDAPSSSSPSSHSKKSDHRIAIIIGGVVGGLALAVFVAFLIIRNRQSRKRGIGTSRSFFSKKQQDLFPPKSDDSLVPLGLYNQERSLPPPPRDQGNNMERMEYMPHHGVSSRTHLSETSERSAFLGHQNSTQFSMDETIPVEAALVHHRHDKHTPQGLHHSISVSSVTSRFPRHSAKSGKLFEEKIQLQVIRYEIQDAHLMAPHGPIGRLVLGTYHIISEPKSARSLKPQSRNNQGLARSGTVVVRKRQSAMLSGRNSPLVEMAEESSMLLTDAENQHTFEGVTLKWYMTEIHWKREAALLKRLKSPIFIMELLESYCIPALQNRAYTYPFVNAMGGRTSLLSDLGPVKTAQHTRAILRSISAAVEWCHRHGVVHLNIQPGSFFLEDDIDPRTEDASWKLWDFTCARYIGERIGAFGGGGETMTLSQYQPPTNPSNPDSFPYMDQQQHDRQMDRIGGNPLPAAYTAPELLEAWRANETDFPVEANMDTWSLGCLYYEILTGYPLFPTEAEAWGLIGGWEKNGVWTAKNFCVPYPPSPSSEGIAPPTIESETNSPYERSQILDPSGSIAKLLRDMMSVRPEGRVSLETIMERIY
ncbi:hypothetical protein FBU30_000863 [Linnemannia zychae]|nr:hypothetical protein FBU30_000863 [Linnemannia zychae]